MLSTCHSENLEILFLFTPKTGFHCQALAVLELRNPPASASQHWDKKPVLPPPS